MISKKQKKYNSAKIYYVHVFSKEQNEMQIAFVIC